MEQPKHQGPITPLDASLIFLGTASMRPSLTRNVSGTALRIGREWTIIDCGEGTQHRIIQCGTDEAKCGRISPANINRVFITHLHGDHCFGLPGIMCLIDNSTSNMDVKQLEGRGVVHIVGPRGLRNMVRAALISSATGLSFRFRVDELWTARDVRNGDQPHKRGRTMTHFAAAFEFPPHPSEIPGEDVRPQRDGTWIVPPHPGGGPVSSSWNVHAAPLDHTIDCVGYAFREAPHRGNMDISSLRGRLVTEENKEYQKSLGYRNPHEMLGELQRGNTATIKEGGEIVTLDPSDYMGAPTPGRIVAVLGDTRDSRRLAGIAANADVIVHEATNAAIEEGETEEEVAKLAVARGHSTPVMAGAFARCCNAKKLVLTHFSSRYKGDSSEESVKLMDRIVAQARGAFVREDVVAARDLTEIRLAVQKGRNADQHFVSPQEAADAASSVADSFLRKAGHLLDYRL